MEPTLLSGKIVDLKKRSIYAGEITILQGQIVQIRKLKHTSGPYIIPGFVDAHVHIESSMLIPSEFARISVTHGTVATVSDPHEIGNVLGVGGVEYMIENSSQVNFKCYFGAPSCVPATSFESAGASIDGKDIDYLLSNEKIKYLAEMMNWPGVLNNDPAVMEKLRIAQRHGKPIDGHAPGLRGKDAKHYAAAGISTDHECFSLDEALEKIEFGMQIIIREGSAAKNFDALIPLLKEFPDRIMFCSDDLHPDNLVKGHINLLATRAVAFGIDPLTVLQATSGNAIEHYGLEVGLLGEGEPADLAVVEDLEQFSIIDVYIDGQKVVESGRSLIPRVDSLKPNNFQAHSLSADDFALEAKSNHVRVIVAEDGQLVTSEKTLEVAESNGNAVSDPNRDLLKIAVINRYQPSPPQIAFIQNFGLKQGAIASSVAHDSHNIIVVGADDISMSKAVNEIIKYKGGVAVCTSESLEILPLPVAGIMSNEDGYEVAAKYTAIDALAKSLGSKLEAPFMTLSFMALLVIPQLKLSDQGLFDGERFEFVDLFTG